MTYEAARSYVKKAIEKYSDKVTVEEYSEDLLVFDTENNLLLDLIGHTYGWNGVIKGLKFRDLDALYEQGIWAWNENPGDDYVWEVYDADGVTEKATKKFVKDCLFLIDYLLSDTSR